MSQTEEILIDEEDTQKDKYLIFSLDKEDYGIEIKYVTEIIGIQEITQVPELPDYIKGVINLRGKIIPVMDVRLKFKKEARQYDDRTCIIVVDIQDISLGLVVDRVLEVLSIPEENIAAPPQQLTKEKKSRFIQGMGKVGEKVKILLETNELIKEEDAQNISDTIKEQGGEEIELVL